MKRRFLKHSPKTVALVGMGPSITSMFSECLTQEFHPGKWDEVWTINMASMLVRHDVVIWMDDLDEQEKFKPGLFASLRRFGKPVITTVANREIVPKSYDYPIDAATAISLPIFGKPYFNNGVAMAIAYAMVVGVRRLFLYGCDFTYPNRNYAEAGRGCTEAWLTLASSRGMEIVLPERTSIFDAIEGNKGVYGYKDQPKITLPDGRTYDAADGSIIEANTYKPEDSSGEKNAVARRVPGTNGSGAPVARPAGG